MLNIIKEKAIKILAEEAKTAVKEPEALNKTKTLITKFTKATKDANDIASQKKSAHGVYLHGKTKEYLVKPYNHKGYDGHKLLYVRHYLGEDSNVANSGATLTGSEPDVINTDPKMDMRMLGLKK